jgi:uncharacterized phage protein (TIGR02218 family)
MLLLDCRDGTSLGITDHNHDLAFDIGDGTVTYKCRTGVIASDISQSASLDTDNYEITGPIGEDVTLAHVLGGKYDRARARMFQINWAHPEYGAIKLLAGNVASARVEGGKFILEIRSDMDRFNQTVGRVLANNCDADFGDARCGATVTSIVGTVTAVTDAMRFTVSFSGSYANDFFNLGTVTPLTGANSGGLPVEIVDWTSGGAIELFTPLIATPVIGDTFTIKNGCSKARKSDTVGVPTCLTYNNVVNFRGFPENPRKRSGVPCRDPRRRRSVAALSRKRGNGSERRSCGANRSKASAATARG